MGCDTICDLPDSLLTQILLNLPTKYSVKTSVLSKRWRNLWLSVPGLDFNSINFYFCEETFARFIDRFMEFNRGLRMQKLYIYHECHSYRDRCMELISTVVDRGIQHLDVYMYPRNIHDFMRHQNIYKSRTLVSLKLANVGLKNPEFVVSLPCLKILDLRNVCYGMDGPLVVERLISGCPVLEDLQLIRPFNISKQRVLLFLHVRSQTLKICCLKFGLTRAETDFTVELDAPRLEYMSLSEIQSDSIVVKNLSSLFMLDIRTNSDFKYGYGSCLTPEGLRNHDILCGFLTGISSVRRMIICGWTLELLYCYSKLGRIPIFHNLYHLKARFSNSSVQLLPALLESCPNLKNFIFDFSVPQIRENIEFHQVPQCLVSTLEYVKINKLIMKEKSEIKLVNYFLDNSPVLKKLTLSFSHSFITKQAAERYKKLLTSPKLSPTCEVILTCK